jgi:NhaP-type Na+/H+ or K+/H+ antiporter
VDDPRLLVAAIAILAYALVSHRLQTWWVSMPTSMLALGLLVGPGLGLFDSTVDSEFVRTTAELTLALLLFHDAVRIDLRALRRGYAIPLRLLGIGLPVMIVLGTAVAYGVMPGFGLVGAALVATMLAPTDAALGEAVVSDTRIPVSVRQGLNVESGLNDGLSVPVFLVLLATAADPHGWSTAALAAELSSQIGLGALGGILVGGGAGLLFRWASRRELILSGWRRIAVLTIALGCFTAAVAFGGSGFIGAFIGGIVFGLTSEARSAEDNEFTEYLGTTFDALSFLLLGAVVLPFGAKFLTWESILYAVISLVAIRMISVFIAMLGTGARRPTLAFMGWFGPRGLATLVFAILLIDAEIPDGNAIAATAVAGVTLSVVVHGFSAPPLVSRYIAWWHGAGPGKLTGIEAADVHEHEVRTGSIRPVSPP